MLPLVPQVLLCLLAFVKFGEVKCQLSFILCPMIIQTVYLIIFQLRSCLFKAPCCSSSSDENQRFLSRWAIQDELDASATSKCRQGEAGRRVRQSIGLSSSLLAPCHAVGSYSTKSLPHSPRDCLAFMWEALSGLPMQLLLTISSQMPQLCILITL